MVLEQLDIHIPKKKKKIDIIPLIKINSKWIMDLSVK